MLTQACDLQNGGHIERRKMGDYIVDYSRYCQPKDSDIIGEAGLDMKEINSKVSTSPKRYFFTVKMMKLVLVVED